MSWLNILKKVDKDFETSVSKDIDIIEEDDNELTYINELKDVDDEFDIKYGIDIYDLQFDFKNFIHDSLLPFMDIHPSLICNLNNTFYNFIKNNSENYYNVLDDVNKWNEMITNEYENNEDSAYDDTNYDIID